MIANIKEEYPTPNAARCKKDSQRIEDEIKAFLTKGGSIKNIDGDLETTDAHKRTKAKRAAARKRGLSKIKESAK